MLERFLQRLDVHPVLRIDMVFRRFLEARYIGTKLLIHRL